MRIDPHTHYTPPWILDDLEGFAEKEPYWGLLITPDPVNHTEQGWATPERMIEDMDKANIDKVVLLGEGQTKHENAVERNNITLDIMRRWPDRVIGFSVVQPRDGQKAIDELKRCVDAGMLGLGEIGHYNGGYRYHEPDFLRLMETCIELDIPINIHSNEEVGHFYLGKSIIPLRDYYRFIERYPELKVIMAHWGGGILFYEIMPEVQRTLKNVWYDSAGGPLVYPTENIFRAALHLIDHRKILYGSDYPLIICPPRQTEPDFTTFIEEIDALELPQDIYTDIMGNNAARLFGLMEEEALASNPADLSTEAAAESPIITELAGELTNMSISQFMAVSLVAHTWPQTRAIFEQYGIPWQDSPVPFWEPIAQAAAARGFGPKARSKMLNELNEAIG
jgi:uncharacterized protein